MVASSSGCPGQTKAASGLLSWWICSLSKQMRVYLCEIGPSPRSFALDYVWGKGTLLMV